LSDPIRQALAEKFNGIHGVQGDLTIADAIEGAMDVIEEMFGGLNRL